MSGAPGRRPYFHSANMTPTATNITTVANHPSTCSRRFMTKGPMRSGRTAISIITTMMGTAMTPLMTALQISALIGSMLLKSSATPPSVASAMRA